MERLTARDPAGNAYLPYCEECGGDMCRYRCEHFDKVCEKLAGYEEQGEQEEKLLAESEAARAELGKRLAAAQKMNAELTDAQAVMIREFDKKLEELAKVKAERDAVVSDIEKIAKGGKTWMCPYCKHGRDTGYGFADCDIQLGGCKVPFTMFEWRGPQKEGT